MSMLRPSINQIIKKTDSPYSLVIAVAKRARDIANELSDTGKPLEEKPVKIAVQEFYDKKYKFVQTPHYTI